MAKGKKEHDQTTYSSYEGFRENCWHYSYALEFRGKLVKTYTNEELAYEIGQLVEGKRVRNIQSNWVYGTKHYLIHLEEI